MYLGDAIPIEEQPYYTGDDPGTAPTQVFVGPSLPSGAVTTGTASPSDISWLQQNELAQVQAPNTVSSPSGMNLPPGPAPRVNVPVPPAFSFGSLASSTIIKGIPDIALYGLGAIALATILGGVSSGGGRRRR